MGTGSVAPVVLTLDVVVLRQTFSGWQVLLIQRGKHPYQGMWALPGGKLDATDSSLEMAACREVFEETGVVLNGDGLSQVHTFGDAGRDPRGRFVSVLYLTFVDPSVFGRAGDDAAEVGWFPLTMLPAPLAFDHDVLLATALRSL